MPRRRRWWLVVLAVVLAAVAAFGNYALIAGQDERVDVLVLVRDVGWGERIDGDDLGIAQTVPDTRLASISSGDRGEVVGRAVRSTLPAGTMLTPTQLTAHPVPGRGEMLVGLPVKSGSLPAQGLSAGNLVQVSPVPAGTGQTSSDSGESFRARVAGVGRPDSTGVITVDVVVDADAAAAATDAAAGQVVLIQLGPGA